MCAIFRILFQNIFKILDDTMRYCYFPLHLSKSTLPLLFLARRLKYIICLWKLVCFCPATCLEFPSHFAYKCTIKQKHKILFHIVYFTIPVSDILVGQPAWQSSTHSQWQTNGQASKANDGDLSAIMLTGTGYFSITNFYGRKLLTDQCPTFGIWWANYASCTWLCCFETGLGFSFCILLQS